MQFMKDHNNANPINQVRVGFFVVVLCHPWLIDETGSTTSKNINTLFGRF